jgi:hypothetical protein
LAFKAGVVDSCLALAAYPACLANSLPAGCRRSYRLFDRCDSGADRRPIQRGCREHRWAVCSGENQRHHGRRAYVWRGSVDPSTRCVGLDPATSLDYHYDAEGRLRFRSRCRVFGRGRTADRANPLRWDRLWGGGRFARASTPLSLSFLMRRSSPSTSCNSASCLVRIYQPAMKSAGLTSCRLANA